MVQFEVRPAGTGDARAMAELFAAVAEERTGIATEPPVDISQRAAQFAGGAGGSLVAAADSRLIGMLHVEISRHGFGELGMLVDRGWRGRGSVQRWWLRRSSGPMSTACTSSAWKYSHTTRSLSRCTVSAASSRKDAAPGNTGGPAASCGTPS